jgi:hypothetical protein
MPHGNRPTQSVEGVNIESLVTIVVISAIKRVYCRHSPRPALLLTRNQHCAGPCLERPERVGPSWLSDDHLKARWIHPLLCKRHSRLKSYYAFVPSLFGEKSEP